jgi:hypothetical protein
MHFLKERRLSTLGMSGTRLKRISRKKKWMRDVRLKRRRRKDRRGN